MKKMLMALSLSGALLGGSAVVWAEDAASTPVAAEQTMAATDTAVATPETVVAEAPATEEAAPAAEAAPTVDTGDTAWILVSTALVLLMTIPGLALFYGGMVRKKNVLSTMMFSLSAAILVSLIWVIAGYSLAFSGTGAYFGDLSKALLNGVAFDALSGTIPESLFVIFQMTFAIITVAIISGSIADRMKYSAFMAFIAVWVILVYAPITHWVWAADGWLFKAGALDFAGGTVVHINSGVAGLVAAYMLGKRTGLGRESMAPHNLTLTVVGASLIWVGWFGFNGGSALGAGARASMAILVTQVAAAAAAFSWLVVERVVRGKASVLGGASGAVAGLVVITPAAGFVGVGGALVMGLIGGVVCFWGITALKRLLKADDALDAFGLHAVGGMVGAVLTGVFYSDEIIKAAGVVLAPTFAGQLWIQVEGVLATIAYSAVVTFIILKVIDLVIGIRVSADDERMGLDLSQHGERIE
ncbi:MULTISPECIES: ammonium transporter [Acinetobacter]|uniref:Ammonium transporter n=1 Tax=Acinetobacter thutiue TaxID=2998078 RepID=A0ABT7WRJ9_9GAMM|nr:MULTISPECIES: ammonium transporter [Acinetobacter]MCY6413196.1 ammonium transporter [Acinetobacter thutiue]MDH0031710.1 ammonium transporter [Acinetobacter sp. GD04021]MDH0887445.1 ammonium transporter [Acinetobacter sp. GD03873]MDH1083786.1 ammonium transporter [Acinetobacter sp. GD03983]MDH2190761.1 ammonium transporter [Acinetobacter sp. GD03645]